MDPTNLPRAQFTIQEAYFWFMVLGGAFVNDTRKETARVMAIYQPTG